MFANPRRRRHHKKHRKYGHNPRHRRHFRRYSHNPMGVSFTGLINPVLSVTSGILSVDLIPMLLGKVYAPIAVPGSIMYWGGRVAALLGGGYVAKKVGGNQALFIAGGVSKILLEFVGGPITGALASVAAPAAPAAAGYGMISEFAGLGEMENAY